MKQQQHTITLSVPSHIKKILTWMYGDTQFSTAGRSCFHFLFEWVFSLDMEVKPHKQTKQELITISVQQSLAARYANVDLFLASHDKRIIDTLDHLCAQCFFSYVAAQSSTYNQQRVPCFKAIRNFLEECNISEDEYALLTAHKRWQRYKNARTENKNKTLKVFGRAS